MCGIAGIIACAPVSRDSDLRSAVASMISVLAHRGPDHGAIWLDQNAAVALGHRRLAILDLSPEGEQPMHSADGRYVLVFNGEIYNFAELRKELEERGHSFRGHSDTEIMLAAFLEWGIESAIRRFVGMFAFALWDKVEGTLVLARDRMGEKPLYYGIIGDQLVFASELKGFRALRNWAPEVDLDALNLFFYGGYVPGPYCIYKGVRKLLPGSYVRLSRSHIRELELPAPTRYWSLESAAKDGFASQFSGTETEATEQLDTLLRASVRSQMVADVPVGAFLSGGIDSSVIVALMQALSSRPVRTFTIGFNEQEYNEARHAAAVAAHLNTDHTELYVTPEEAMAVIPRLPEIYDEPFSDSSQIPTFLVSRLARSRVTVSLSGDAGDELFGGYPRYSLAMRLWSGIRLLPSPLRRGLTSCLNALPTHARDGGVSFFPRGAPTGRSALVADRLLKAAELLPVRTPDELYWRLNSHWDHADALVPGSSRGVVDAAYRNNQITLSGFLERMCYADSVSYLPDDILVKVDRATMAVSLEARVPLLDYRVVEFAWRLPTTMKMRDGQTKWLLRQVLYKYVPRQIIERPKMGFGVPIEHWLRGPLRDWAEELLSPVRLKREGFLNPKLVRDRWEQHLSGKRRWHYSLWDVLMFQAWLEKQRENSQFSEDGLFTKNNFRDAISSPANANLR
jgi:asparagine synthase (glutamine-hydrolysing)